MSSRLNLAGLPQGFFFLVKRIEDRVLGLRLLTFKPPPTKSRNSELFLSQGWWGRNLNTLLVLNNLLPILEFEAYPKVRALRAFFFWICSRIHNGWESSVAYPKLGMDCCLGSLTTSCFRHLHALCTLVRLSPATWHNVFFDGTIPVADQKDVYILERFRCFITEQRGLQIRIFI